MTTETASVTLDATHDPALSSWVETANAPGHDFPIQNLPFGRFRAADGFRLGVAIGDSILDLRRAMDDGVLTFGDAAITDALASGSLNAAMGWTADQRRAARQAISAALRSDATPCPDALVDRHRAEMAVPAEIGDYTDFYCSIHHATNVGSMFRPDNPLMPNYKHLPVGYHGRASSIVASGTPITRPHGQTIGADATEPTFGPSRLLDYELELGAFLGPGNAIGSRIDMGAAGSHLFGICLVNDWSARDVQKWEYQPLGPFNAKNFATSVSPWVVTGEALTPYRVPGPDRPDSDPPLLDYLQPVDDWGLDIHVEVLIASAAMREAGTEPMRISIGNTRDLYWTMAQMLAHHTSTGCPIRAGDLIASGTLSGPDEDSRGCLLERTWRGQHPISLPDGTERKFLQDGDEVILRGWCEREGAARIGLGECRGIIAGA